MTKEQGSDEHEPEEHPLRRLSIRGAILDIFLPWSIHGDTVVGSLPEGYEDIVVNHIFVKLTMVDRLRLVFQGHIHVGVFNYTEHVVGYVQSTTYADTR